MTGWRDPAVGRDLERDGFVRLALFDEEQLQALRTEAAGLDGLDRKPFFASHVDVSPGQRRSLDRTLRAALEPVVASLHADVRVFATAVLSKAPSSGSAVRLHQDLTYTDEERRRSWVLWVPLVAVDATTGPFSVVAGSHRWSTGVRPGGPGARAAEAVAPELTDRAESIELRAGEALVWDAALLHGSAPNRGAAPRLAVSAAFVTVGEPLTYFHAEDDEVTGHLVDDDYFRDADRPFFERPEGYRTVSPWRPPVTADELAAAAGVVLRDSGDRSEVAGAAPPALDTSERATAEDRNVNYALIEHRPLAPVPGKLRSSTILYRYWDEVGMLDAMAPLVAAVREEFGVNGTAWGVKQSVEGLSAELYWYFHGDGRPLTSDRIASMIESAGFRAPPLPTERDRSWYSLSIDLAGPGEDPHVLGDAHVYVTHHPSDPRTSLSYRVGHDGLSMENVYYLFDPTTDRDRLVGYLAASPSIGEVAEDVFFDELVPCDHIALAHKPTVDGLYYGGIDVARLRWFLGRLDVTPVLAEYVAEHEDDLDHLRFDVGVDIGRIEGVAQAVKVGIYGVL